MAKFKLENIIIIKDYIELQIIQLNCVEKIKLFGSEFLYFVIDGSTKTRPFEISKGLVDFI